MREFDVRYGEMGLTVSIVIWLRFNCSTGERLRRSIKLSSTVELETIRFNC
jgi:hypothetical protein